jgi:hypothetical protein
VLNDHRSSEFVRLATAEAELTQLLNGDHDLVELVYRACPGDVGRSAEAATTGAS